MSSSKLNVDIKKSQVSIDTNSTIFFHCCLFSFHYHIILLQQQFLKLKKNFNTSDWKWKFQTFQSTKLIFYPRPEKILNLNLKIDIQKCPGSKWKFWEELHFMTGTIQQVQTRSGTYAYCTKVYMLGNQLRFWSFYSKRTWNQDGH